MTFHMGREFLDLNSEIRGSPNSLHALLGSSYWTIDMVAFLLEQGAQVIEGFKDGKSALLLAIKGSRAATCKDIEHVLYLLLQKHADPYMKDNRGVTVSHLACDRSYVFGSNSGPQFNKNLRLRKIWTFALRRAGYNAEEVMSVGIDSQARLHCHCRKERWLSLESIYCALSICGEKELEGVLDENSEGVSAEELDIFQKSFRKHFDPGIRKRFRDRSR